MDTTAVKSKRRTISLPHLNPEPSRLHASDEGTSLQRTTSDEGHFPMPWTVHIVGGQNASIRKAPAAGNTATFRSFAAPRSVEVDDIVPTGVPELGEISISNYERNLEEAQVKEDSPKETRDVGTQVTEVPCTCHTNECAICGSIIEVHARTAKGNPLVRYGIEELIGAVRNHCWPQFRDRKRGSTCPNCGGPIFFCKHCLKESGPYLERIRSNATVRGTQSIAPKYVKPTKVVHGTRLKQLGTLEYDTISGVSVNKAMLHKFKQVWEWLEGQPEKSLASATRT